jgi:hypothetical protein
MAMERRDTDKHNEELRAEADEVERKVSPRRALHLRIVTSTRSLTFVQMADHLKRSEAELSELLAGYWALRNRTCKWTTSPA